MCPAASVSVYLRVCLPACMCVYCVQVCVCAELLKFSAKDTVNVIYFRIFVQRLQVSFIF